MRIAQRMLSRQTLIWLLVFAVLASACVLLLLRHARSLEIRELARQAGVTRNGYEHAAALNKLKAMDRHIGAILVSALDDRDWRVRAGAADALGQPLGYRPAIGSLTRCLSDRHPRVRDEALSALQSLQVNLPVHKLMALLRDGNASVRATSAYMLRVHARDPVVASALIDALRDRSVTVATEAAFALSDTDDPRVLPLLIASLRRIAPTLEFVGPGEGRSPRGERAAARLWALRSAMSRQRSRAFTALVPLLSDPCVPTRCAAAYVLGHLGDERAMQPLRHFQAAGTRFEKGVAAHALRCLGRPLRLSDTRAHQAITPLSGGPEGPDFAQSRRPPQ